MTTLTGLVLSATWTADGKEKSVTVAYPLLATHAKGMPTAKALDLAAGACVSAALERIAGT